MDDRRGSWWSKEQNISLTYDEDFQLQDFYCKNRLEGHLCF